jgi:hypothetical protein
MGLFTRVTPPQLPLTPKEYDASYGNHLNNVLGLFFQQLNAAQPVNIAGLNIDIGTLPTEAALATLRSGDVYRDTAAGNVLKIKP